MNFSIFADKVLSDEVISVSVKVIRYRLLLKKKLLALNILHYIIQTV